MGERPAAEGAAMARIRGLLAVGRRLASPSDELGRRARRRLAVASGLSPEGVALALEQHLETDATEEELARFVGRASRATRAAVVLSANVCTGALRALAFGLATAPHVLLKPSRRDPVLAELLARELDGVALVATLEEALERLEPGDELHVYGSDETLTMAAPLAAARGVVLRGHGTGFGVAVIGADARLVEAAEALAADLVPFDGRGCLSPRLALIEGEAARAADVAAQLHEALERRGRAVPRGELAEAEHRELALYRHTLELVGDVFVGEHHLVALDPEPQQLAPAPAHRATLLAPLRAPLVTTRLGPLARWITCIGAQGSSDLVRAVAELAPHARVSPLGSMQRPPFDGPVDLRHHAPTNTRAR
jgi:hypothetical protein